MTNEKSLFSHVTDNGPMNINGEVHPTVGTDKYVKEMEKQLAEEPIKISGFAVERSFSEKYLGVMISARRSRETVISNMKYRVSECEGKLAKIRRIPRRPEVSCVLCALIFCGTLEVICFTNIPTKSEPRV